MIPSDFDELARLWTQEQSPEEERLFQQLARRAGWQARALHYAEYGMGGLLIAAILIAIFVHSAPATLIVGGLTVAAILWAGWKRRLRQVALLVDTRDREAMLASAVQSGRASLRRSKLGLLLLIPGFLLGSLLKHSIQRGSIDGFFDAFAASLGRGFGATGIALLLLALAYLFRSHLRLRREVVQLEKLQAEYRAEALLDGDD